MENEKDKLTEQQRTALKPLFDKLESAYAELDKAMAAAVRREGDDADFGFCFRCPKPGRQELCSSFKGPGKTHNERCQREFCGHPRFAHF